VAKRRRDVAGIWSFLAAKKLRRERKREVGGGWLLLGMLDRFLGGKEAVVISLPYEIMNTSFL
jgi:hypothetical protein